MGFFEGEEGARGWGWGERGAGGWVTAFCSIQTKLCTMCSRSSVSYIYEN
jgi:hypothetical protein